MIAFTAMTAAGVAWADLPQQFGHIFYYIVLPMLLLVGLGFVLQRRLGLDMPTLMRLNFYMVVPGIIYFSVVTAELRGSDIGIVIGFHLCMMAALAGLTYGLAMARGVPRDQRHAMLMAVMFYNSGNYGLALQDFAYREYELNNEAVSLQTFVMITQNVTSFTLGILLAAAGGTQDRHWKDNLKKIATFPPIYALIAALVTIQVRSAIGASSAQQVAEALAPFWDALEYVAHAFFAIALCTLGAQLALVPRGRNHRYPVKLSVLLRLLIAPVLGLALIYALGLSGFIAQVLLISTATPTAVNCMMLCVEFDNHPDFVARSVFYSTILSPITVTLVVLLAQGGIFERLALAS